MIAAARRSIVLSLVLIAMVAAAAPAVARTAGQQPPATGAAQDEFVPVTDLPAQEQLPAAPLVMTAYAFVWVMLAGYLWSLWRRLSTVEREIHRVASRIEDTRRP